ncbi:MAG TPA: hypothetical protein VNJ08_07890 [Bacteriovoracaceae bacterium]|nr:hypothetical protein [Bacteriovoracaceae bacterium]
MLTPAEEKLVKQNDADTREKNLAIIDREARMLRGLKESNSSTDTAEPAEKKMIKK